MSKKDELKQLLGAAYALGHLGPVYRSRRKTCGICEKEIKAG